MKQKVCTKCSHTARRTALLLAVVAEDGALSGSESGRVDIGFGLHRGAVRRVLCAVDRRARGRGRGRGCRGRGRGRTGNSALGEVDDCRLDRATIFGNCGHYGWSLVEDKIRRTAVVDT
jgi:hypothetical protein